MFASKSSVIFFSLLILNVALKSTQAMPTDVEPREYDEYNGVDADDYNFFKNEADGLRVEMDNEYIEDNYGDILNERAGDIEDETEDDDGDLIGGGLGEDEEDAPKEEEEVIYELEGEDDNVEDEEGEEGLGAVFGWWDVEDGLGELLGKDEEREGKAFGENEEVEDQVEEDLDEVLGGDEEGEGEDQVEEGLGEVLGEDEGDGDKVEDGEVIRDFEEGEGDDKDEGDSDEYQGNVYQKGARDGDNDEVDGDDNEDDFTDVNPRKFPYTWLDRVKEYFHKIRNYLGM